MKIYCDKCHKDITSLVNNAFETNKIGNIVCPHCKTKQARYISETDLLVYLAYQESIYFVLTFITSQILLSYKLNAYLIILFILLFVLAIIATSLFKINIYNKGYFKRNAINKVKQNEDQTKISRSIRWQFLMFFAIAITFFTTNTAYWFFVFLSIVCILITLIKAILSGKSEQ